MNEIFNIRRFGKYFTTDFKNCLSSYGINISLISLMGIIIYVGTIVMGLLFNKGWEGPSLGFRVTTFIICMSVLIITMPVRCYGMLTEKKAGSEWLLIPVSQAEKVLSMIIMTLLVAPVSAAVIYLSADALLCSIDNTCGESLFHAIRSIRASGTPVVAASESVDAAGMNFLHQVTNPWLYIDDIFGACLIFLLGAICFRKGKVAKTFLAISAVCTAASAILIPIVQYWVLDTIPATGIHSIEEAEPFMSSFIFRHPALIDTINDTIVNLLLVTGIYIRVKTLKH